MTATRFCPNGTASATIARPRATISMMWNPWIITAAVGILSTPWTSPAITITTIRAGRKRPEFRLEAKAPGNDIVFCDYYKGFSVIIIMGRFRTWLQRSIGRARNSPLWRLFLTGIKGQLDTKNPKPYNFYTKILTTSGAIFVMLYLLQFRKNQMDICGHNIFIPDYIYRVRQESYIYWQTVRLAKGMPTFLTFYKWDQNLMYEIDRNGKQTPFHAHKGLQNTDTFQSPLHEYNFPATPQKHSRILMYLKNLDNPYNLHNYLRLKPITVGDWLRAAYYWVYRELGLSNRWRYDEYVRKPDIYYRVEKIRLAFRLDRDRERLYAMLDQFVGQLRGNDIVSYFVWFL